MRLRMKVQPADRTRYLYYCGILQRDLEQAETMRPVDIADMCRIVLTEALGSKLRLLLWLVIELARKQWDESKDAAWWAWHLYIRRRTVAEILEIVDRQIEEITGGEDPDEWAELIASEERQQIISKGERR